MLLVVRVDCELRINCEFKLLLLNLMIVLFIVNFYDFEYILNFVNMCVGKDVYFIVYVYMLLMNFWKC